MHDAFISYAFEDNDFASDIAYGLKANGLSVWFAPISLGVGDKLLDSVEGGIQKARTGVLILSPAYLAKGWTTYEMDILVRQHIEKKKKILPIWRNVSKEEVESRHAGLSGIFALTQMDPMERVLSKLVEAMSDGARVRGVIPSYEDPARRFLVGLGEVNLQSTEGPATSIFKFLIHTKDEDYPLWLAGRTYSKEDLLLQVAQLLGPDPERAKQRIGEDGYKKLWKMCVEHDLDPGHFY
ncbi:TIR domain-containing protein [Granulicella sp. 5B5]|uniref:toll/interleukin-1 receptor domain-containing protein n=1 Tax=Granulicella sp. 5B5 TaxID=1617967 RepID=UPI0015F6C7F5|nr:toll/interleukin-1 receptor domain-containing protein [Granulicella sp. 5B5]QMV19737.1 TIR domain-containing protein [Granulicella sp. 5B5]